MADQMPSLADELRKLADLKKDGVLTEEEFAAAKADLLRSLKTSAPPEPCTECKGTKDCSRCDGTGQVTRRKGGGGFKDDTCPECDGSRRCRPCRGTGNKLPQA